MQTRTKADRKLPEGVPGAKWAVKAWDEGPKIIQAPGEKKTKFAYGFSGQWCFQATPGYLSLRCVVG